MSTTKKKRNWTESDVMATFGLRPLTEDQLPLLQAWLAAPGSLLENERSELEALRRKLEQNVRFWNEEELKMGFLAFILDMADYNGPGYRAFFDREISAVVGKETLSVKADYMLATGIGELVQTPYFCFHEYKRHKKGADDPAAQLLLAMLIAREANQDQKPIYGCYVIGQMWYFVVFTHNDYATARPLDATNAPELERILLILRHFKTILGGWLVRGE